METTESKYTEMTATCEPRLEFRPITLADLPAINSMLQRSDSRTCDYTLGGIYMWID